MKLMTFNILGATVRAEAHPWKVRGPICVELIKRRSPDLLAVQELEPANFETFAQDLQMYEYRLGPIGAYRQIGYQSKNPHNYNAIYWKPDLLEVIESGEYWLSDTPDRPSQSWGADLVTGVNWIRFRTLGTSEFLFLNVHLDNGPESARVESARLIVERVRALRRPGEPTIVCGDMNAAPGTPPYETFELNGFRDTFKALGNVDQPEDFTIHLFEGSNFSPKEHGFDSSRIDQVWLDDGDSSFIPRSYSVVEDKTDGQYPSDHYPVVVEFE